MGVVQCENMFLLSDDSWEVRDTPRKGKGIFATKQVEAGCVIGDYLGMVIKTAEYDISKDAAGLYLMYLSDRASIYPDLNATDLHLINHSCKPNSWMYTYKRHTLFFALQTIDKGEEITISYLLSPKDETCELCLHVCYCGEICCTGSMHMSQEKYTAWRAFQQGINMNNSGVNYRYGQLLRPLSSYPDTIPIDPIYEWMLNSNSPGTILDTAIL